MERTLYRNYLGENSPKVSFILLVVDGITIFPTCFIYIYIHAHIYIHMCIYIYIHILLFIFLWLCWVVIAVHGPSLAAVSGDYSPVAVHGILILGASLVAEHQF